MGKIAIVSIMSTALAGLFFWLIKIKAKRWLFLLLGLLPLTFVFLWTPNNRMVSSHSFWHTSIVYQIMNGNIPPNNPLLAGEPLLYPWVTHLLVAGISYGLQISPPTAFALMNFCALLITMSFVYEISKFFSTDWIVNVFAVFLSIFGLTFIGAFFLEIYPHPRPIPAIKFNNVNCTHLGVLFFTLFLYSFLHIFSTIIPAKRYYATFVVSVVGAGFFYPFHWLGVLACGFSCCLILYLLHGRKILRKAVTVLVCMIGGSLVVLPYLYLIATGRSGTAPLTLASPFHIFKFGFVYLLSVLPISIILFWKRKVLLDAVRIKTDFTLILTASIVTTAVMYVFLSGPLEVEYKFLMISHLSFGILGSICFRDLYLDSKVISFILVASFLLPFSSNMFGKIRFANDDFTYIIEDGMYLRHSDLAEDNLYQWIANQTKSDDIFIASNLSEIALFGRRQVYYTQSSMRRGWYFSYQFLGYSNELIGRRKQIIDEIYSDSSTLVSANSLAALNSINSKGDVHVITRESISNKKLENSEHFERVFENGMTRIYKLRTRSEGQDLTRGHQKQAQVGGLEPE